MDISEPLDNINITATARWAKMALVADYRQGSGNTFSREFSKNILYSVNVDRKDR